MLSGACFNIILIHNILLVFLNYSFLIYAQSGAHQFRGSVQLAVHVLCISICWWINLLVLFSCDRSKHGTIKHTTLKNLECDVP